ncbi:MAG: cytochrome c oxidase assembly protein [Cyanobacteria bacterium REEB67]|nr:cytochrome c oxidase assembly protein [Cyanobacteria bacterium REEB67]
MTSWKLFLSSWEFAPPVVIGCSLLLVGYFFLVRPKKIEKKSIFWTLGVLTLFFALVSPLDKLGEDYLFCLHMAQHMLLGIIAPVFLVCGLPKTMVESWLKIPFIARLEKILGNPPLTLIAANGTFWLWHLPGLYDLTLENDTVHIFEHITLIVTGVMLWWPVFKPVPQGRLTPLAAILYLALTAFISTILGVIFTISDTPYYERYAHPEDELGALKLIREDWGLTQLDDQKLGGAIMWEPAGVIFLWAMMLSVVDWLKAESRNEPDNTPGNDQIKTNEGAENA